MGSGVESNRAVFASIKISRPESLAKLCLAPKQCFGCLAQSLGRHW